METQRIAVKVGTSTLTHSNGAANLQRMEQLVRTLADLKNTGYEVVLITSGAIGIGAQKLRLSERPTALAKKQAAAAVGQCAMMHLYDKFFSEYSITVGQILMTLDDVRNEANRQHLLNTFHALLDFGVLPIVNENDSVSHEQIASKDNIFGDNDTLSAVVADMCGCDLLVLLSDIDGLYDSDPRQNPDASIIETVTELTRQIRQSAAPAGSARGTGGMITKLQAAELCQTAGIDMVIANGARPEDLYRIASGEKVGTRFLFKKDNLS